MPVEETQEYIQILKERNEVLSETNKSLSLRIDFLTRQIQNRDESILHYKKLYEDCKDSHRSQTF